MRELSRYFKGYLKETILGPLFKLFEATFELLVQLLLQGLLIQSFQVRIKAVLF